VTAQQPAVLETECRKALLERAEQVARISTQFTVTEVDWAGHVHYEAR
jgi:hypothetical protein